MAEDTPVAEFYKKHENIFIFFLALIPQLAVFLFWDGRYQDTDSYTHALRAADLLASGGWAETPFMHDNYPFGQILHFTRIADVFWLICSLLFLPFLPMKQAVFYGGLLYQPIMMVSCAFALLWAMKPYFSPMFRLAGVTAFFLQTPIVLVYMPAKPDHHVMINFFCFLTIGCFTHAFVSGKEKYFSLAGIFAALMVWTSPEGSLLSFLLIAGLAFCVLLQLTDFKVILVFTRVLFAGTLIFLVVNPPYQGFFHADNSRLSFLIVVVFGFTALAALIEQKIIEKGRLSSPVLRFLFFGTLGGVFFGLTVLLFGKRAVLSSPISPELWEVWGKNILELMPAFENFSDLASFVLPSLLMFLLLVLFYKRFTPVQKQLAVVTGAALVLLAVMAFFSSRFGRNASIFLPFAVVLVAAVLFENRGRKKSGTVFPLLLYAGCLFYLSATYAGYYFGAIELQSVAESGLEQYFARKGGVMAEGNIAPKIAWETGRAVVGSPYHTNEAGIIDMKKFFNAVDDGEAMEIVKKRGVGTVVLRNPLYMTPLAQQKQVYFHRDTHLIDRLYARRGVPCWLVSPAGMPPDVLQNYLIFVVDFTRCPGYSSAKSE